MKTRAWVALVVALAVLCLVQQAYFSSIVKLAHREEAPGKPPAMAYDLAELSNRIRHPQGATGALGNPLHLSGEGYGTAGFTGVIVLDTSDIDFGGEGSISRGERISKATAFYASQIRNAIPGSWVERALPAPGVAAMVGNTLHATIIIRHPGGFVVLSGGYLAPREDTTDGTEVMAIHVLATNNSANTRTEFSLEPEIRASAEEHTVSPAAEGVARAGVVDREKCTTLGVSPDDVTAALVRLDLRDPREIESTTVTSKQGVLVPLSTLVAIVEKPQPAR